MQYLILSTLLLVILSLNPDRTAFADNLSKAVVCNRDQSMMVLVPAGSFTFGISKEERRKVLTRIKSKDIRLFQQEFSSTTKHLNAFYIDKFEVTNRQYAKFMKATKHRKPKYWRTKQFDHPDQPVVGVGWADAEAYAKWAGKRLPTEPEWEKAARGDDSRIWPWGNKASGKKYNGLYQANYAPVAVGSFPEGESPYGVMDMAGNVYEMTSGKWTKNSKVMRGGSYLNRGAYTRTTFRWSAGDNGDGAPWLGFRLAIPASEIQASNCQKIPNKK